MEDTQKIEAKLASLLVETGEEWIATNNTNHLIDITDMHMEHVKTFVCPSNGAVLEYPYSDYSL